jgi:hypothetical protein
MKALLRTSLIGLAIVAGYASFATGLQTTPQAGPILKPQCPQPPSVR